LNQTLPLDQTLFLSTAKKQNMQMLLNNLSASADSSNPGLLSIDEIRNAAIKINEDLQYSARLHLSGIGNILNITNMNQTIAPLKLDFGNELGEN
jgi:hypothetical protein